MALISLNHRFNHYQLFVYYLTLIDICLLIGIDSTDQIKIIESNVTIYSDNETNYFNLSAVSLSNQFKSAKIDDNLTTTTTTTESTTINKINVINFDEGEQLRNESTISVPKELPIKLSTDNPIDCVNTTVNLTVINDIINLTTTKLTNNKLVDLSIVTKLSSNMIMIKPVNDTNNITINKVDYNQHHHDNDSVNDDNNNLVKMKLNITSKSVESLPEKNSSVNDVDNQQTINTSVNGFKVNHDHGVNLNHDDDEIISTPFSINITTSITTGTIDNYVNNGPSKWSVNLTNSDHNNNGNNNNDHHHLPDDDNEYPHGKFQQHHQTKLDQHEITSQLQVSSTDEDEDSDSDSGGQIVVIGGVNNPGVGTGTTGGSGGINDGESDLYLVSSRRKCQPSHSHGIYWDSIDASLMASKLCPSPYMGTAYRACYSMGHWDTPDLTECRLPHLREIQNLIFYHVHKHLVDGLYPLAEELNRLLLSTSIPILSPMDKLDALDSLNSILKAKVRIKLDEDEDRDHLFIKSLISSSEQLLTKLPLTFTIETEKNALLTMKSAETIFGLKALSESLLRTLIVFCNDGTIRRIKSFNSITKNIAITLTHITPFGDRISLLHSELNSDSIEMESDKQNNSEHPNRPKAHIFLDDLRRYGIGISEICLHLIGNDFNTDTINLISDLIVISVVPPISIEANFERIPQVEIDFNLTPSELRLASDNLICGKIKSPRDCWMSIEGGMMFSFIVPVSILIMSNTITMLLILKRFFAYKPITHKIEIERVEPALRSGVSLLPFFAVNWFLSVLALEDTATDIFQYLFAFCNLIQHLLVFLFHCYQRPEIYQRFSMYFAYGNGSNRISKSSLKSKRNYWCSGHCATVPLLIYSDDGSARLHDNCFDDPTIEASRFKDQ
ncbi:uncharacterized protein LOC128388194 isoform X2 [Panonychus citri]|uniref:uncharacterized protein LOC128388194 isoform X2 n=1 Tax=Panonychus citri TaxID=50023 RepID=UPI0023076706|nr:uncharacterized protein LOC128388194 isoform X2 [Panonychus citri]